MVNPADWLHGAGVWVQDHTATTIAGVSAATLHIKPDRLYALYARVGEFITTLWRITPLVFRKDTDPMNILQLVTTTLRLGEDGFKLVADIKSGDRAAAIAAVKDAVPEIALLTGKSPEALGGLLSEENIGAALDLEASIAGLVLLIEKKLEGGANAAPDAPAQ